MSRYSPSDAFQDRHKPAMVDATIWIAVGLVLVLYIATRPAAANGGGQDVNVNVELPDKVAVTQLL